MLDFLQKLSTIDDVTKYIYYEYRTKVHKKIKENKN